MSEMNQDSPPPPELTEFVNLLRDLQLVNNQPSFDEERAKRLAEIKRLEAEILATKSRPSPPSLPISSPLGGGQPQTKFQSGQGTNSPPRAPILPPLKNSFSDLAPISPHTVKPVVAPSSKPFPQESLSLNSLPELENDTEEPLYYINEKNDTTTKMSCQEEKLETKIEETTGTMGLDQEENQGEIEVKKISFNQQLKENLDLMFANGPEIEESFEQSEEINHNSPLLPVPSVTTSRSKLKKKNQEKPKEKGTENTTCDNLPPENLDQQFQSLLSEMLLPDSKKIMGSLEEKVNTLERQINDPQELMNLLLPLIAELLNLKVLESKDEVIKAIVPIIDAIIQEKSEQDKEAMVNVMANIIPGAIAKQIADQPQEVIQAIAPAMGESIKEQIRLEKDAMVDALYPVIGNTISKYMSEVIQQINQKVESALSVEGIRRKIRAKMKGVSEAELIIQESMPFKIQAVFLIHKASGLVMSEAQPHNRPQLEADMLAGMLTAIRSFASECSIANENTSELTEIEYESSKIMMEVAGYCYLAVIVEGEVTKEFIKSIKSTLSTIILNYGYGNLIKEYDGDEETIPQPIHDLLEALLNYREKKEEKKSSAPLTLMIILFGILLAMIIPFGLFWHRQRVETRLENQAKLALSSTPEIAVYRLDLDVEKNTLILKGKLPNEYLRAKAEAVAKETLPALKINNQIIAVEVPPDPLLISAEVQRLTNLFNQRDSVIIHTTYQDDQVTVTGHIRHQKEAQQINQSFREIPGIKNVLITLTPRAFPIDQRFYFNYDSAQLTRQDLKPRIREIVQFLNIYPQLKIRIIGHTDPTGPEFRNKQLSVDRALMIKNLLVAEGIEPQRLVIIGIQQPPWDVSSYDPLWLGRCVRFERIM